MEDRARFGDRADAILLKRAESRSGIRVYGEFEVECYRPDGSLRWRDGGRNIVVNEGLNHILDILFVSATAQVDPWYVGLLGSSPSPLATWTATEIGANDFVNYDEATLQAYTDVRTNQSVDNSASKAVFTISTNGSTIGGAFLISTDAKATPAGTVLCAVAFTGGNKSADDNDVLNVTYTFTAADS